MSAPAWVPGDPVHPDQATVRTTCGRCGTSWVVDVDDCPICPPLDGMVEIPGTPDDGHTFEVRIRVRGASSVAGFVGATDGESWFPNPRPAYVRAHNLPAALRAAADLPLTAWFEG